jgi:hypothetical protein
MDDNIWEYPFGELDDDEDLFFEKPFKGLPFLLLHSSTVDHKPPSFAYN